MIYDRVHMLTETSGTGPYTLGETVTGRRSILDALTAAGVTPAGARLYLWILPDDPAPQYEFGEYTFDGTDQLTRTRIISSSNSNAEVNWGATAKNVISAPNADLLRRVFETVNCGTTGGSNTAFTSSPKVPIAVLNDGDEHVVLFHTACGNNPTYNPSDLGAKKIYRNVSGSAVQLVANDVPQNFPGRLRYNSSLDGGSGGWVLANEPPSRIVDMSINDFRLTLTSGTPATTVDVTGATTIYCTPYKGNRIALYGGTRWNIRTSAEFSLALGTLTSGLPYDVFCYDDAGTPTLEFLAWTNGTTRATALSRQDGILVKSGDATRRYLGTFCTTSTTETEDSATRRYLWNYYHRVPRKMLRQESTASWTYTTATYREANGSTANRLAFVVGVSEDVITAQVLAYASNSNSTGVGAGVGIGMDSTSVLSSDQLNVLSRLDNERYRALTATYSGYPGVGAHYLSWLEYSDATGTCTWRGSGAVAQCGIFGQIAA